MTFSAIQTIPILRMFSVDQAEEFYLGYLGFAVDWRHRFADELPLYMQISRGGLALHLSEHHGDGTPGTVVYVRATGLAAYHAELAAKAYRYLKPGLDRESDGSLELDLTDPFGNRLRLVEKPPPAIAAFQ